MAIVCAICTSTDHYSDVCPSLLEPRTGDHPEAYYAKIYNNRPPHQQQHYDPPSSRTYNPGWRNHAPLQNNDGQNRPSYVPPPIQQQRQQMINNHAPIKPSFEELVRQMTMQNIQFQQEAELQFRDKSMPLPRNLEKCQGPCTFTVPCIIGVVIQLANRSTTYIVGFIEDVLVRVDQLIFPANFYILDMEEGSPHSSDDDFVFHLDFLHEFTDTHLSNFLHDFHAPSDINVPCTSLYICHACTDFEMCDSCIDKFLNIVVDSPVPAATKPSFVTFVPTVLQAPNFQILLRFWAFPLML
ncbi:hypothetical protein Lal_00039778, partial [Lupinus albus]